MKKVFSVFLSMLLLITLMTTNVYAVENNFTKIKLGDLYVNVPYNEKDIIVEYENNDIEVKVTIRDKHTGKILGIHGEYLDSLEKLPNEILKQLPKEMQNKAIKLKYAKVMNQINVMAVGNYFNKVIYSDETIGTEATVRLYCDFEYYSYLNYRNITSVISHNWAMYKGNYDLESEVSNAIIQSDTVTIKVYGRTNIKRTIVVTKSQENEYNGHLDVTIRKLVNIGFSATTTSSTSTTETILVRYSITDFSYFYSIG